MTRSDHHRADQLTKRVAFLKPIVDQDEDGMMVQRYDLQFTLWGHVLPLRGGEQIMQARMVAKAPAIVTVRAGAQARQTTSDWRVQIGGKVYEVKENPRETQDRAFLELLVEGR